MLGALKKVGKVSGKVAMATAKANPVVGAGLGLAQALREKRGEQDAEATAAVLLEALAAYLPTAELQSVHGLILAMADRLRVGDELEAPAPAEPEKPEPQVFSPNPNEKLSESFVLKEFLRSDTADRLRIANTPHGPEVVDNLRELCVHILQPVRDHFGRPLLINSGYRSPELNAAVTGNPNSPSQHSRGEAADIEIRGVSNHALAIWIRDSLPFDQLILENHTKGDPNSGWVHVSRSPSGRQRGREHPNGVLTMVYTTVQVNGKTKRKPKYLKGLVV